MFFFFQTLNWIWYQLCTRSFKSYGELESGCCGDGGSGKWEMLVYKSKEWLWCSLGKRMTRSGLVIKCWGHSRQNTFYLSSPFPWVCVPHKTCSRPHHTHTSSGVSLINSNVDHLPQVKDPTLGQFIFLFLTRWYIKLTSSIKLS